MPPEGSRSRSSAGTADTSRDPASSGVRRQHRRGRLVGFVRRVDAHVPSLTVNIAQESNLTELRDMLLVDGREKRMLVIGAGTAGPPFSHRRIDVVLTDVVDHASIDVV